MRRLSLAVPLLSLLVLVLLAAAAPAAAFRIVEFCPDTYLPRDADAYFVLGGNGSLAGLNITDGEGFIAFPRGASAGGRVTVADEGLAFQETHGILPDFELKNTTAAVPDMVKTGRYAPANDGDELDLSVDGRVVQSIRWPGDFQPREGQVHFLVDGGWDPRALLLGQSQFLPRTFGNATVTGFVSPDSSYGVLESAITGARQEILVNAYELSHPGIGDLLVAARRRGVAVRVLLEGGPVGGISPGEEAVCAAINGSGIPLEMMTSTASSHARYRYDHAKYLVIDGRALLVSTENFGVTGFPLPGSRGNRGWGALIEDQGVAGYFGEVFSADAAGGDVIPYTPPPKAISPSSPASYPAKFAPLHVTGVIVTPVLAPDTSGEILALLGRAHDRIDIEQASIRNSSRYGLDPYLAAAVNASRRGVAVRVLLDGSPYNDEGPADNNEMVDLVNGIARQEGLPLTARILDPEAGGLVTVHTKGAIVDGGSVLISSINWNSNSPNFNREAGVILESPALASYYTAVFDSDWDLAEAGPGPIGPDIAKLAIAGLVVLALLLVLLVKRRR